MRATETITEPAQAAAAPAPDGTRLGVLSGVAAYCIWGSFPILFKALHGAAPLEIVCHRIVWSVAFMFVLVTFRRQLGRLVETLGNRQTLLTLCGTTLLIATNWLVFIYAVQHDEVLQASLGYFVTPLISVLLGCVFLRERLGRWQQLSVLLAAAGVFNLALHHDSFPWIALLVSTSFALYGLLRKTAKVEAMVGLAVETLLLAPLALAYLFFLAGRQEGAFLAGSLRLDLLLPFSGVATAIPLMLFVAAARRLQLATIGFLQYITPSLQFALAVGLYGEAFTPGHLLTFLCIWAGLAIYSGDALWSTRALRH